MKKPGKLTERKRAMNKLSPAEKSRIERHGYDPLTEARTPEENHLMNLDIAFQNIAVGEADFARNLTTVRLTDEEKEYRRVYKAWKAASESAGKAALLAKLDELHPIVVKANIFRGLARIRTKRECELCNGNGSYLERGEIVMCPSCRPNVKKRYLKGTGTFPHNAGETIRQPGEPDPLDEMFSQ